MFIENNDALVTIVCSRDQAIQELQSHSIDRFVRKPCDHYVIIEDSAMSLSQWHSLLNPYYTRHRLILLETLLPKSCYQNDTPTKYGWHRQALLKLVVAEKVLQDRYLILDTKNFFIKDTVLQDWPCTEGNNIVKDINKVMPTWPNLGKFCQDYNIPMPEKTWSPTTPFMVKTNTVRDLIKYKDLYSMFLSNFGYSSELILYSVFAHHRGCLLQEGPTANITFWNNERDLNKTTLEEFYSWPELKTIGLHRYIFKHFDDLSNLIDWSVEKGLDRITVEKCLVRYQQDTINRQH